MVWSFRRGFSPSHSISRFVPRKGCFRSTAFMCYNIVTFSQAPRSAGDNGIPTRADVTNEDTFHQRRQGGSESSNNWPKGTELRSDRNTLDCASSSSGFACFQGKDKTHTALPERHEPWERGASSLGGFWLLASRPPPQALTEELSAASVLTLLLPVPSAAALRSRHPAMMPRTVSQPPEQQAAPSTAAAKCQTDKSCAERAVWMAAVPGGGGQGRWEWGSEQ